MPLSADPSIRFPVMKDQAEVLWTALGVGPRSSNLEMYDNVQLWGRKRQDKQKYQRQYIRAQMYIADTNTYLPADQASRVPAFYKKKKWDYTDMKKVTHMSPSSTASSHTIPTALAGILTQKYLPES